MGHFIGKREQKMMENRAALAVGRFILVPSSSSQVPIELH